MSPPFSEFLPSLLAIAVLAMARVVGGAYLYAVVHTIVAFSRA